MAIAEGGVSDYRAMREIVTYGENSEGFSKASELAERYKKAGRISAITKIFSKIYGKDTEEIDIVLEKAELLHVDVELSEEERKKLLILVWGIVKKDFNCDIELFSCDVRSRAVKV